MIKVILIVCSFLTVSISQAAELRSKKIKTQICQKMSQEFYRKGIFKENCLACKFLFSKKPIQVKVEGRRNPITTRMLIFF